jgi:hypothetical protein
LQPVLINENRFRFDLNSLGWDYLGHGKNESALNEEAKSRGLDPKADMWQLPGFMLEPMQKKMQNLL